VGISDIRKSSNKDIPEHVARISGMEIWKLNLKFALAVSINPRAEGAKDVRRERGKNCFSPCNQNRLVLMVLSTRSTRRLALKFVTNMESRCVHQNDNHLSVVEEAILEPSDLWMETDRKQRPLNTAFVSYAENLPNSPLRITGTARHKSRILPPRKARSFLGPHKDSLGLKHPRVYVIPCERKVIWGIVLLKTARRSMTGTSGSIIRNAGRWQNIQSTRDILWGHNKIRKTPHFTGRVMRETIEMHLYHNVNKVGGYQSGCDWKAIGNTISSICAAPFSNMCWTQADNSSRKLRLCCGCQFPYCALALKEIVWRY
jgi:hypothetical protein